MGPLITHKVHEQLQAARQSGRSSVECSLDLDRNVGTVEIHQTYWQWQGQNYPYLERCKERTIYYWTGNNFEPVSRYNNALIKLVDTLWGPPTFEIDGIKMLPTAQISPFIDAQQKVELIQPRGKVILDCCAGLGYFAHWCREGSASRILSYEKNPDVVWLRSLNPWSPSEDAVLQLIQGDITQHITTLSDQSCDAILHDPPRFGIAGELYSQVFYDQLARVLKRKGRMFHYTGAPNKLTSGRDVPNEVATRLQRAGFSTEVVMDGVLAIKK